MHRHEHSKGTVKKMQVVGVLYFIFQFIVSKNCYAQSKIKHLIDYIPNHSRYTISAVTFYYCHKHAGAYEPFGRTKSLETLERNHRTTDFSYLF